MSQQDHEQRRSNEIDRLKAEVTKLKGILSPGENVINEMLDSYQTQWKEQRDQADAAEADKASAVALYGQAKAEVAAKDDLLETAWGIICNAGGGDWDRESVEWKEAAERFREQYFKTLPTTQTQWRKHLERGARLRAEVADLQMLLLGAWYGTTWHLQQVEAYLRERGLLG